MMHGRPRIPRKVNATGPMDVRDRIRRGWAAYNGWVPTCPPCGRFIEECACVCAFCGERSGCRCCIGLGIATGGD